MAMGGVGEAALLGAAMGGGSAMLTGADPLKGALMGTLTGGIGGAVSPALSALTTTAPLAATTAATSMAPTLANAAAMNAAPAIANTVAMNAAPTLASTATAPLTASTLNLNPAAFNSASLLNSPMPFSAGTNFLEVPGLTNIGSVPFGTSLGQLGTGGGGIANLVSNSPIAAPATFAAPATPPVDDSFLGGMKKFADNPLASLMENKFTAGASALVGASQKKKKEEEEEYTGPLSRFKYNPDKYRPSGYADGGIASLGAEGYDRMVGEQPMYQAMARGGISDLGSYSDYSRGGRMLKGPGDGMSDNIPATIAGKRPARLADGEFVIPADVVSHLGNGSTDAGAKQLYAMMDKVRKARTGRKAQGREINPRQYMAA
jgi:hypothetical protein